MTNNIAKYKKDELILKMQGTKKNTCLKDLRQNLLGIKKATDLAEILDITQQTLSKLERGINRLSGSQYLAICSLLDKEKNSLLNKLRFDFIDKEIINTLEEMSFFYNVSFTNNLIILTQLSQQEQIEEETKKEIIDKIILNLLKCTCFDNWLSCVKCKESITKEKEKELVDNGIVIMSLTCKDDIILALKILNKHLKKTSKGMLFFDYREIVFFFKAIKEQIEGTYETPSNGGNDDDCETEQLDDDLVFEFIIKFSMLKKADRIKFIDFSNSNIISIIPYMTDKKDIADIADIADITSYRMISFISQNTHAAEIYKANMMQYQIGNPNVSLYKYIKKFRVIYNTCEFLRFEQGSFKIWEFSYEFMEKCFDSLYEQNDDTLKEYLNTKPELNEIFSHITTNIDKKLVHNNSLNNMHDNYNEIIGYYQKLEDQMDTELEDLLDKLNCYLKPTN